MVPKMVAAALKKLYSDNTEIFSWIFQLRKKIMVIGLQKIPRSPADRLEGATKIIPLPRLQKPGSGANADAP